MESTDRLLADAKRRRAKAVEHLLAIHYPFVWRLATGLTGNVVVGRNVARRIMQRSIQALASWKDPAAATRWFHHHTLLATRQETNRRLGSMNDCLFNPESDDAGYLAFISAIRSLPMQHREALILAKLENFSLRQVSVAMDCSTTAAENHLNQAMRQLQSLAGEQYERCLRLMSDAYQNIAPDETMIVTRSHAAVRRILFLFRALRLIKRIAGFALLLAAAWGTFWVWRIVQHSMQG